MVVAGTAAGTVMVKALGTPQWGSRPDHLTEHRGQLYFTAYLPTIAVLELPGPALLPSWLAWLAPVAALWVWAVALGLWRTGTRHYQGGGG